MDLKAVQEATQTMREIREHYGDDLLMYTDASCMIVEAVKDADGKPYFWNREMIWNAVRTAQLLVDIDFPPETGRGHSTDPAENLW